ncbi:MAG: dipicolinate synthase subunit DpsA [Oscillospiraceae bacterium]|jgi:dipicolinate synthase subunit A
MIQTKIFSILGGDPRQAHLANALAVREDGFRIYAMMLHEGVKLNKKIIQVDDVKMILPQSNVVILPLPLLGSDGKINAPGSTHKVTLEECLTYIHPDTVVLAGKVPAVAREQAAQQGVEIIDYLDREEFAVLNAVPTAEGAVEIALREMPIALFGATCLITGYGRIAKVLAGLLRSFGAKVMVAARKWSDLAWVRVAGCQSVHLSEMAEHLPSADLIINTVPSLLFEEDKLALLKRSCLIIDLASKPGGVDLEAAKTLGLKAEWALSLPGKVAPVTAGVITLDTIFNILHERGAIP